MRPSSRLWHGRAFWIVGGASVLLALAVAGRIALRVPVREPAAAPPALTIEIVGPRGEIEDLPEAFSWRPVPGARRYTVRISDDDAVWPLFVRTSLSPAIALTAAETAAFQRGRLYTWEIEAQGGNGALIGIGGARFRLRPLAGS